MTFVHCCKKLQKIYTKLKIKVHSGKIKLFETVSFEEKIDFFLPNRPVPKYRLRRCIAWWMVTG